MARPAPPRASLFVLCASACIAGIFSGTFFAVPKSGYALYFGQKFAFQGLAVEEPSVKGESFLLIVQPAAGAFTTSQKILVTGGFSTQPFAYGDKLYITGKIVQPKASPDFDYPNYLAAKGVFAQVSYPSEIFVVGSAPPSKIVAACLALKHALFRRIEKLLPQADAGLIEAILTGDKSNLDAAAVAAFSVTGTAHVIAISGYKLTLVVVSIEAAGAWVGRRTAAGASVVFAVLYLVCSGFAPAVLRAVVMSTMFVLARTFGRRYAVLPSLLIAALVILIANPLAARFDFGFLLSFVGILGIVYVSPIVEWALAPVVEHLPTTLGIRHIFVGTTAAQIATAPLIAYSFHQFSFVAPVANLLVVPLLAPLIGAGYALALPALGVAAAAVARFPLAYVSFIVNWLASLPFAYANVGVAWWGMALIYAAEVAGIMWFNVIGK
jgi:competence protein ComEC